MAPLNWGEQIQEKIPTLPLLHVPPFKQGAFSHGFGGTNNLIFLI